MHALVAEAMRKAAIAWIGTDGKPPYPIWCLWIDDALYVVSGGDEQPAPGLAETATATVSARGDHDGRIVTWRANTERLAPGAEAWSDVAAQLASKRLNASGTVETVVERWATAAIITKLTPADDEILPATDSSEAAPPRETPASKRTAKPFKLHRVKRR